jgi:pantetheine-phosphate adenylyltransferase
VQPSCLQGTKQTSVLDDMSTKAVYAGSFDPITLGHLDIIKRASGLFDHLVVAIGNNPAKRYWFDLEQRKAMLQDACAGLDTVSVVCFSGLLIHLCENEGANVIVRGLRALSDFDLEFRNGLANRDMTGIETVFLLSDPKHIFVSSSLVKEIAQNGGDVRKYVPPGVLGAITERLKG